MTSGSTPALRVAPGHSTAYASVLESVDVVVPVYNEEACIDEFIERVAAVGLRDTLIFVDNGSTDGTVAQISRHSGVRLIRHRRNLGYGASIRDGLLASSAARVVIIDADLEYPPEAIPRLVTALVDHPIVYGSRFSEPASGGAPWLRRRGNRLMTGAFNLLFSQRLTDLYTGMKALRGEVARQLCLQRHGFDHVVEMAVELASAGHRIAELPVTYTPRTRGVSKMRHVRETVRGVLYLGRAWLGHRRFFTA